ncbi:Putative mycofactocin biosynthesis glycosyltransferase MftF [Methylacidimicrobium cyclopophantes]|uniref:Mycofactocin biosynthesis glycosyltransferase MftF n=2 Tax=Methylacidimicrobium cyclopophantes TaxID=1041766 RepID=A0A5E6M966_9BACT|nr:Putative mycofactocin biosynthesis glycosyltransferase MftF [Methylacidimicrobium cyclopophantes]
MGIARVQVRAKFFFEEERKFPIQGVSYGPFAPRSTDGAPFPEPATIRSDFSQMKECGCNVLRVYHIPPLDLLDSALDHGLRVLITIPWVERTLFWKDPAILRRIEEHVRQSVRASAGHPAIFAYLVDNEIPPDLVRWAGIRRIERHIDSLIRLVREEDREALVSYANYPPTEYLRPSSVDFVSFNVYLHRPEELRAYLARLQNLSGEKPLLISEFGMDTRRHSEIEQADLLAGHIEAVFQSGGAGTILFSWTDEWFTGGSEISDWAFGLVRKDRTPKESFHRVKSLFRSWNDPLFRRFPLRQLPKISVIVCNFNGGRFLGDCIRSLQQLQYPDFEIIVVDDGSTDGSRKLLETFEGIRVIHQENGGLSVARNRGIAAAEGEVLAFTDADCVVDEDWLYFLASAFQSGDLAGVGGPNIAPPPATAVEAVIAAAPGSPSHVLLTDRLAEHLPGCNMAFRRTALEKIGGFVPEFRVAGDDVDLCWRLLDQGFALGFSPGALVWHRRRSTVSAYLRQQAGYGKAEGLLRFRHPSRFRSSETAFWRGRIYPSPAPRIPILEPIVYRGAFASGLFQYLYARPAPSWFWVVTSMEWFALALLSLALSFRWPWFLAPTLLLVLAGIIPAALYGFQSRLSPRFATGTNRFLLSALALLQPLVRSLLRRLTWLRGKPAPTTPEPLPEIARLEGALLQEGVALWSESGIERIGLLDRIQSVLEEDRYFSVVDDGWSDWDIQVFAGPWWQVRLRTLTEVYPQGARLLRVAILLKPSPLSALALVGGGFSIAAAFVAFGRPALPLLAGGILTLLLWLREGLRLRRCLATLIGRAGQRLGLIPVSWHPFGSRPGPRFDPPQEER